jgi:hypothetical protein
MKNLFLLFLASLWISGICAQEAPVRWLTSEPGISGGQSWGIPWTRGQVQKNQAFVLKTASGKAFPVQTWPLAYWPDGSVKWSGMAASLPAGEKGPFTVQAQAAYTVQNALTSSTDQEFIRINTGAIQVRIPLTGDHIIEDIVLQGNKVVGGARLVNLLEDHSQPGVYRQSEFSGILKKVTLEQSGPLRAVVKLEGMHRATRGQREWMPFTVRLYFYAGQQDIRMVHTIVYDGDQYKDFVKGLGVVFTVPMREEIQNRHVAFSGANGGIWAEPIQPLSGRAFISHPEVRNIYGAQLEGKRLPNKSTFNAGGQKMLGDFAMWDGYKLNQLSANGFSIVKRTGTQASWLAANAGQRAGGLAYAGDVSGGLAVSLKNFWQSFPASLEVQKMRSNQAELTVWLWSPDAEAMDLRHYDTIAHDLNTTYEDVQEGLSTPYGVARTSELFLFPVASVPARTELAEMSRQGSEPARLISTPEYFKKAGAFGTYWSLPDRSKPTLNWIENQLDSSIIYYNKMVESHNWYGFWNYGDFMHAQDVSRHSWKYDIGGYAWDNSELAPDNWLWYTFLRSGNPTAFKLAEAMTRHTGEVDCYHIGELKGLGSRHNVSHWGCGAKEARIAQAGFRRYYYYLTTDERVGDVMREMLDGEYATVILDPMRIALPKERVPIEAPTRVRFGPDWISFVANWMTEWERTGDTKWRDKIVTGMDCLVNMPNRLFSGREVLGYDPATGKLTLPEAYADAVSSAHLATIMGGAEMMFELLTFLDHKKFADAWLEYCTYYSMPRNDSARAVDKAHLPSNSFVIPRLTAYAAMVKKDDKLAARAWSELLGRRGLNPMYATRKVSVPAVLNDLEENGMMSTNDAAIWSISAIFLPGMIGDKVPDVSTLTAPAGGGRGMFGGFGFGAPAQETQEAPKPQAPALPEIGAPAPRSGSGRNANR